MKVENVKQKAEKKEVALLLATAKNILSEAMQTVAE